MVESHCNLSCDSHRFPTSPDSWFVVHKNKQQASFQWNPESVQEPYTAELEQNKDLKQKIKPSSASITESA